MKLNAAQIEQTLHQIDAKAIPVEDPVMPQLKRLFGDHTYFLDGNGLNIVEPVEPEQDDLRMGVVVTLANWINATTANTARLQPHEPEPTDLVVNLEIDLPH